MLNNKIANIKAVQLGMVRIVSPTPNEPVSIHVTFDVPFGSDNIIAFATAATVAPGASVVEVSVFDTNRKGMEIYQYRKNSTSSGIYWIAFEV